MTLYEVYDRGYDYARKAADILERIGGIQPLHERGWDEQHFIARCQSILDAAGRGETDAWNELMYVAASAELARHEREVVRVDTGSETAA